VLLDRLFGKKRSSSAATADDLARSQQMAGRETGQSAEEQAATRSRMETEMAGQREQRAASAPAAPACLHTTLTPRWDNAADMGNAEKVSSYTCQSCHQTFTAAEGQTLLATEAERIRQGLGD
jgi:hypothetical protein